MIFKTAAVIALNVCINLASGLRSAIRSLAIATCLLSSTAFALDSNLLLQDFHHDTWSNKQGAPGAILGMAQTQDGWLWLATDHGLYRFDGVRFEPFRPYPGEQLLGRRISTLYAGSDGDLWIGYISGGVSQLQGGRLHHHAPGKTPLGMVYEITVDVDGTPWVATNSGLFRFRHKEWEQIGESRGLRGLRIENIFLDHTGRLWTANGKKVLQYDRSQDRMLETEHAVSTGSFSESPDGSVWVTDDEGVQRLTEPETRPGFITPDVINQSTSRYGLFDKQGNYWTVHCPRGVCRVSAQQTRGQDILRPEIEARDRLSNDWQLSNVNTVSMLEDREGNIWVGTWSGLERFRHNKLVKVSHPELGSTNIIVSHTTGELWVFNHTGHPSKKLWHLVQGEPPSLLPTETIALPGRSLNGNVFFAGQKEILRKQGNVTERIPLPLEAYASPLLPLSKQGIAAMVDDGRSIWAIFRVKGLYRYRDGEWKNAQTLGLPMKAAFIAAERDNVTWVVSREGAIYRVEGDSVQRISAAEKLDIGPINYVHPGKEMLVSGENGTALRKGDRFIPLKARNPEVLMNVSGYVVTPDGDHWLNGAAGLVHIKSTDWIAYLGNLSMPLRYEVYNGLDGYPGTGQSLERSPSAVLHTDGRLWVAGNDGVAWLYPNQLKRNLHVPPVQVQGVETEKAFYRTDQKIVLSPEEDRLRIDFTALSYTMPERLQFQYLLEGQDSHWQEAGTRRSAYYTNLSPGSYTFRVRAVNEDGVWNQQGATLSFRLQPTFWQSPLFLALCLLLFITIAATLYRWRIQQLNTKTRIKLAERERIARALHDTLLQGVQALILRFQSVAARLPAGSELQGQVIRVLDQADEMMVAGRDQVMDLRLSHDLKGDLSIALNEAGLCMAADHPAGFHMRQEGEPQLLWSSVSDESYSIGREALSNAFRHADASEIQLSLTYGAEQLSLSVSDNGKGIPTDILHNKRRPGHWGLTGMRERAERLGGTLSLGSTPTGGTEVVLAIPARLAYLRSAPERCWQRAWRRLWQRRK